MAFPGIFVPEKKIDFSRYLAKYLEYLEIDNCKKRFENVPEKKSDFPSIWQNTWKYLGRYLEIGATLDVTRKREKITGFVF